MFWESDAGADLQLKGNHKEEINVFNVVMPHDIDILERKLLQIFRAQTRFLLSCLTTVVPSASVLFHRWRAATGAGDSRASDARARSAWQPQRTLHHVA